MITSVVVAINESGTLEQPTVIGAQEYDPRSNADRPARIAAAVAALCAEHDLQPPGEFRNAVRAGDVLWMKAVGDFRPGMVEIGLGRWGFRQSE